MRCVIRSRSEVGQRSRSRNASARSAPTVSCPTNRPSAIVAGLPMSWSSAAIRIRTSRPGLGGGGSPARVDRPVRGGIDRAQRVIPEVLPVDLVLGDADAGQRARATDCASSPESWSSRNPIDGSGARRSRPSSIARRSPERWRMSSARSGIAAHVEGSIENPSSAARRTARIIRSASSSKRRGGSPTARRSRAATSARPPWGSMSCRGPPGSAPQAMAFTVKSRRARSSSIDSPNSIRWGRRKSA